MGALAWLKAQLVHPGVEVRPIREIMASVVVFLVALPLCIAIASATGLPATLGLVTGIIGGLIVGWFAGSPLQVSGPAAGLVVLVVEFIDEYSIAALGFAVLLAGLIQIVAGALRFGRWFRATSPAVIRGMLAGIGVLILSNQFHVMVDDQPRAGGLANLISIPESVVKAVGPYGDPPELAVPEATPAESLSETASDPAPVAPPVPPEPASPAVGLDALGAALVAGSEPDVSNEPPPKSVWQHRSAAFIGVLTIIVLAGWNRFRPDVLRFIPGALLAVLVSVGIAAGVGLDIAFVQVPKNLADDLNWVRFSDITMITQTSYLVDVLAIALIASAETLLCATAVDRLHDGPRTNYDKELFAQGIGNVLCGIFGALPMTGVIVRSSANVDAGAKTRFSAILHGFWLLALIVAIPWVLGLVPRACLAGILVYIGWKLMNLGQIRSLWQQSRRELVIFLVTVTTIVVTDLLTGVVVGLVLAGGVLLWTFSRLEIVEKRDGNDIDVYVAGAATFVGLPRLAAQLESLPQEANVRLHVGEVSYIDPACRELIDSFIKNHGEHGVEASVDWGRIDQKTETDVVFSSARPRSPAPLPVREVGPPPPEAT